MPHSFSQRLSSRKLPPAGRRPKWRSTSVSVDSRATTSRSSCLRVPRHRTHVRTAVGRTRTAARELGGRDSNPDSWDQNPVSWPLGRLPKDCACAARYYDASGVCAHGRHHRRRRGNAYALFAAQGPAPALRASADPVAGGCRAGGRRREDRRRRQPEAAAGGPLARGCRDRDPGDLERHRGSGGRRGRAHRRRGHRRRDQRRRPADHRRGDQGARRGARAAPRPRARWPRWSPTIPPSTAA